MTTHRFDDGTQRRVEATLTALPPLLEKPLALEVSDVLLALLDARLADAVSLPHDDGLALRWKDFRNRNGNNGHDGTDVEVKNP